MNISAISANYGLKAAAFKGEGPKPIITPDTPDNEVVCYSSWGENYAYPVTAGQIRAQEALNSQKAQAAIKTYSYAGRESDEEYYNRKLFSPEWFT